MPRIPRSWMCHRVTFTTTVSGPRGDVTAPAKTIRHCYVEEQVKLFRGGLSGEQETSSAQVIVFPKDHLDVGTLVTIWPGTDQARETKVLGFKRYARPGLMDHSILYLE